MMMNWKLTIKPRLKQSLINKSRVASRSTLLGTKVSPLNTTPGSLRLTFMLMSYFPPSVSANFFRKHQEAVTVPPQAKAASLSVWAAIIRTHAPTGTQAYGIVVCGTFFPLIPLCYQMRFWGSIYCVGNWLTRMSKDSVE